VPDDQVVLLPNIHIIGEVNLNDTDKFLASPDLIDYAAGRGWFDPDGAEPFNADFRSRKFPHSAEGLSGSGWDRSAVLADHL
jgi:dipeptidase